MDFERKIAVVEKILCESELKQFDRKQKLSERD